MQKTIKIDGVFSDHYHAKAMLPSHQNKKLCIFCGKEVSKQSSKYVYLTGMNNIVLPDAISELRREDDLGYYEVGSECAKRIPHGYTIDDPTFNW